MTRPTKLSAGAFFLKWFRERRGLSQRDLAKIIGVNNSYIAQVETDRLRIQLDLFKKIYQLSDYTEKRQLLDALYREIDSYITD